MTIEQIARNIIQDIKAFPDEAKQSQDDGGPKTIWDEYKEQVQYEEYDSFEVLEETIESMVVYDISTLSDDVIEDLYRSMHKTYYPATLLEMKEDIKNSVLRFLEDDAKTEDIEYMKPGIEFIRYFEEELTIVAQVLEQIGPEEYLIQAYSEATGTEGEQGVVNLSDLDDEHALERIGSEEFILEKNGFWKSEN
jgi:hypothetical protein